MGTVPAGACPPRDTQTRRTDLGLSHSTRVAQGTDHQGTGPAGACPPRDTQTRCTNLAIALVQQRESHKGTGPCGDCPHRPHAQACKTRCTDLRLSGQHRASHTRDWPLGSGHRGDWRSGDWPRRACPPRDTQTRCPDLESLRTATRVARGIVPFGDSPHKAPQAPRKPATRRGRACALPLLTIRSPHPPLWGERIVHRPSPLRPDLSSSVRDTSTDALVGRARPRELCLAPGCDRGLRGGRRRGRRELHRCQRDAATEEVGLGESVPPLRLERLREPEIAGIEDGEPRRLPTCSPGLAPLRCVLR